jgi:hypothetical protein
MQLPLKNHYIANCVMYCAHLDLTGPVAAHSHSQCGRAIASRRCPCNCEQHISALFTQTITIVTRQMAHSYDTFMPFCKRSDM